MQLESSYPASPQTEPTPDPKFYGGAIVAPTSLKGVTIEFKKLGPYPIPGTIFYPPEVVADAPAFYINDCFAFLNLLVDGPLVDAMGSLEFG